MSHRVVNLMDPFHLLAGGNGYFTHNARHAPDAGADLIHAVARKVHKPGAGCNAFGGGVNKGFDLFRRLSAAAGQVTYFPRNDREPTALLPGTRRFHRGVKRQNIGLEGDAVNDAGDIADFRGSQFDGLHGADGLSDDVTSAGCGGRGLARLFIRFCCRLV